MQMARLLQGGSTLQPIQVKLGNFNNDLGRSVLASTLCIDTFAADNLKTTTNSDTTSDTSSKSSFCASLNSMMRHLRITIPTPPNPVIDDFFIRQLIIQGQGDKCLPSPKPACVPVDHLTAIVRKQLVHNMMGLPVGFRSTTFVYILPGVTTYVAHFKDQYVVRSIPQNGKQASYYKRRVRFRKFPMSLPPGKDLEPYFLPMKGIKKRSKLERIYKGNCINLEFYLDAFCCFLLRSMAPTVEPRLFIRSIFVNTQVPRHFEPQGGEEPSASDVSEQPAQPSSDTQKPELVEGNPQVPSAPGGQCQSVRSGFQGTTLPPNFCRGAYFISQSK
jgi:hypothetical protein